MIRYRPPLHLSRFTELGRDLSADIPCRDGEVFFSKWGPTFIYILDFSSLTLPRPLNLLEKDVPLIPLSAISFQGASASNAYNGYKSFSSPRAVKKGKSNVNFQHVRESFFRLQTSTLLSNKCKVLCSRKVCNYRQKVHRKFIFLLLENIPLEKIQRDHIQ